MRHYSASKPGGGFTLTELLVVCGVVAVLASLLLLPAARVKSKARNVRCMNLLWQIGRGLQMYVQDHKGYPPLTSSDLRTICFDRLYPYYPVSWTNAAWNCPNYVSRNGILSRDLLKTNSIGISYAYNYLGVTSWAGCPQSIRDLRLGLGHLDQGSGYEARVVAPSEMYAVADARCLLHHNLPAGAIKMTPWSLHDEAPPLHDEHVNVLFCDGHVGYVRRKDYLYPPRTAANWNIDHQPHPEAWAPPERWVDEGLDP
jgi:prepilin-type processing-associated H-X9-DG protein